MLTGLVVGWLVAASAPPVTARLMSESDATALADAAADAIKTGDTAKASTDLDGALAAFQKLYADEKRRIYCGMNGTETLLYMGMAAHDKVNAVAAGPGWCFALFMKGYLAVDAGRIDEAREWYNRTLAMAPMHWQFLAEMGFTYRNSDPAKSLDLYKQAEGVVGLIDKSEQAFAIAKVRHGQGYALSELTRFDEAEAIYRQCLKADPDDKVARNELTWIGQQRSKSPRS